MRRALFTLMGALAACASLDAPQGDGGLGGGGQSGGGQGGGLATAGGAGGGMAGGAGGSGGFAAAVYPSWQRKDVQPQSPRFNQTYGLGVFQGRPLVAILMEGF